MDTKIIVAGAVVVVLLLAFVLMSGKPATSTTPQPAEQGPTATFDASEVDAGDSVDDQDLIVDETVPEEP